MKKKILVTLAFVGLLSLAACNNYGANDNARNPGNRIVNYDFDDDIAYNRRSAYDYYATTEDRHYDFVAGLGFENVVNPNGTTYHERYKLNDTCIANDEIFHSWRHTWVEPSDYVNKDIDVYRYTGNYNGEPRTIHIKSYNGRVLGGYHFGEGETAKDARIVNHDNNSSRIPTDFKEAWDSLFNI